ncbi:hypothetical protein FB45DRAFT_874823 [Roridomyces roridus]|uniref:Uncharacterized protein n=1 Tax=Roridomyces roridus TaxID=1738132 RepID=A0AAD7B7J2_9AGAR|nr:hypothetical protein FB45DRAFT_874823 [Roridomyces roridus]
MPATRTIPSRTSLTTTSALVQRRLRPLPGSQHVELFDVGATRPGRDEYTPATAILLTKERLDAQAVHQPTTCVCVECDRPISLWQFGEYGMSKDDPLKLEYTWLVCKGCWQYKWPLNPAANWGDKPECTCPAGVPAEYRDDCLLHNVPGVVAVPWGTRIERQIGWSEAGEVLDRWREQAEARWDELRKILPSTDRRVHRIRAQVDAAYDRIDEWLATPRHLFKLLYHFVIKIDTDWNSIPRGNPTPGLPYTAKVGIPTIKERASPSEDTHHLGGAKWAYLQWAYPLVVFQERVGIPTSLMARWWGYPPRVWWSEDTHQRVGIPTPAHKKEPVRDAKGAGLLAPSQGLAPGTRTARTAPKFAQQAGLAPSQGPAAGTKTTPYSPKIPKTSWATSHHPGASSRHENCPPTAGGHKRAQKPPHTAPRIAKNELARWEVYPPPWIPELVGVVCSHVYGPKDPIFSVPRMRRGDLAVLARTSQAFSVHALQLLWDSVALINIFLLLPSDSFELKTVGHGAYWMKYTMLPTRRLQESDFDRMSFYAPLIKHISSDPGRADLSAMFSSIVLPENMLPNLRGIDWMHEATDFDRIDWFLSPHITTVFMPFATGTLLASLAIRCPQLKDLSIFPRRSEALPALSTVHHGFGDPVRVAGTGHPGTGSGRGSATRSNPVTRFQPVGWENVTSKTMIGTSPTLIVGGTWLLLETNAGMHTLVNARRTIIYSVPLSRLPSDFVRPLCAKTESHSNIDMIKDELRDVFEMYKAAYADVMVVSNEPDLEVGGDGDVTMGDLLTNYFGAKYLIYGPFWPITQYGSTSPRVTRDPPSPAGEMAGNPYPGRGSGRFAGTVSFINLTSVSIFSAVGIDLDNTTVTDMARSWPRIESIELQSYYGYPAPRATLLCLESFPQNCPHLIKLCIDFDATMIPSARVHAEAPLSLRRLETLGVGGSPITSASNVAAFIGTLFPNLRNIERLLRSWNGSTSTTTVVREAVEYDQRWGDMASLLPGCKVVGHV